MVDVEDAGLDAAVHELDPVRPDLPLGKRRRVIEPRPHTLYPVRRSERFAVGVRHETRRSAVRHLNVPRSVYVFHAHTLPASGDCD